MHVERVPGYECNNMAAFRRTVPVIPGNVSVAEEDSCFLDPDGGTGISSNRSSPVEFGEKSEVEEDSKSFGEDEKEAGNATSKSSGKKGKKGRKATWKESYLNDMVDIIVSKEHFKKNLIFTNTKNCRNSDLYGKVLDELNQRHDSTFPSNVDQICNKFKKLISECKKLALTVKTATGIKRIQDDKGYGTWFDQLFPLIKSRDSCNPELSVEPSTLPASTKENEKTRKRSSGGSEVSDNEETSNSEPDKSLFVPIKKAAGKRKGKDETVHSVLGIMNAVLEKDPAKDLIKFFQEENEKAREHELKMMQMFMASSRPPLPLQNQHSSHAYGSFISPYAATTRMETNPSYGFPSCSSVSANQSSPHEGLPYYSDEPSYQQL